MCIKHWNSSIPLVKTHRNEWGWLQNWSIHCLQMTLLFNKINTFRSTFNEIISISVERWTRFITFYVWFCRLQASEWHYILCNVSNDQPGDVCLLDFHSISQGLCNFCCLCTLCLSISIPSSEKITNSDTVIRTEFFLLELMSNILHIRNCAWQLWLEFDHV